MLYSRQQTARCALMLLCILLAGIAPARSYAAIPAWVEPRALNIADLAGAVPDALIAGHIISYGGPGGLRLFESSEVDGNTLRIRVRLHPRYHWDAGRRAWVSVVGALGQRPVLDRMSSSTPESWVRFYEGTGPGAREVTHEVLYSDYADPGLVWPVNPAGDPRYDLPGHLTPVPQPMPADGIYMPANWGGHFVIAHEYHDLHGVYTVVRGQVPAVTYLGQESLSYPSYIGPGYVGWFGKLMDQMRDRYDDRHPRFTITPPPTANYVMFIYEPMPFDLDVGYWGRDWDLMAKNIGQPVAGTVRYATSDGMLSQDLQHSGPFPLRAWWQDADQSAGPYLSLWTMPVERVTPPEFVALPGTPYDPCFVNGGCKRSTLEQVYNQRATLRVVYLSVQPSLSGNWVALPLRMADTNWQASLGLAAPGLRSPQLGQTYRLFLPLVQWLVREIPVPAERPVGFFDPISGRMVGYWPQ